ncbi:hypothetical protein ALC57_15537 [Trachymyrmex cornetzi]|uniref:Uncharacterized protein n=1 Tax=Trachymyrmex cornetzi TaxID=471704 RepID=A0A151IWU7_9HYME|nr:hypothetical protein ALC57_15537 [Trachymyrmex cornetzi]
MPINFATTCNRAFHGRKIYSDGGCRPGVGGFGLQIRLVSYLAVLHNELREARGWHRTCARHVWEPSVWKSASSHPSHPNSSFNLVHDHLKQRAHAHASVNIRDEHPWCTRGCTTYTCPRCLFRRRFPLKVPNSLPSLYYHRKKRAIANLALSNGLLLLRPLKRIVNSQSNDPGTYLIIALQDANLNKVGWDRTSSGSRNSREEP